MLVSGRVPLMAGCQCISNSLGPFKSSGFSFNDTAQLFMDSHLQNHATELPGHHPNVTKTQSATTWWLNQQIWNIWVKLGIFPNFRGEHQKKPPASNRCFFQVPKLSVLAFRYVFFFREKDERNTTNRYQRQKDENGIQLSFHTLFSSMSFKISSSCIGWTAGLTFVKTGSEFSVVPLKILHMPP